MSTHTFRTILAVIGAAGLATLGACGSDESLGDPVTTVASTGAAPTPAPPTATVVPATVAITAAPTPTDPSVATTSTTTITATAPPTASGWTAVDPAVELGPLAFPCCASNWYGIASPALPAPGGTLADGNYAIEFAWPSDFTQPVVATVTRFETCNVLPAGACEDIGAVAYADEELGIDESTSFELSLSFDNQLQVVLGGFAGWEQSSLAMGNGADMAALITALDADYKLAIMDPFLAGTSQEDIAAALSAAPVHGFSRPAGPNAGALVYTYGGAPPLLFQGLVGFDETPDDTRGSDIIGRIALVVDDGRLTINTYAGFYS